MVVGAAEVVWEEEAKLEIDEGVGGGNRAEGRTLAWMGECRNQLT